MFDVETAFTYIPPTPRSVQQIQAVRDDFKRLARTIEAFAPESADRTVALRKLHEASMAVNYAIVAHQQSE